MNEPNPASVIRSRVAQARMSVLSWQPMETAPKDGTVIDVWLGDAYPEDVAFYCLSDKNRRSTNWHWLNGKFRPCCGISVLVTFVIPSHWMPLLGPPA